MSGSATTRTRRWPRGIALSAFFAGTTVALSASAAVPASLMMKVTRFGISTSETCDNMLVFPTDAPEPVDLTKSPTLASASVPFGTYHCVALEFEPAISFAPQFSEGACKATTQTIEYCPLLERIAEPPPRPPGVEVDSGEPPPSSKFDGVQPLGGDVSKVFTRCTPEQNRMVVYLTTQAPDNRETYNGLRPPSSPSDTEHGIHLGAPLVVGPNTVGTLVVSVHVVDQGPDGCATPPPTFTFVSSSEP